MGLYSELLLIDLCILQSRVAFLFFFFFFSPHHPDVGSCLSIAGVGLVFGHLRVQLMALVLPSLFAPLYRWNLRVVVTNRLISSLFVRTSEADNGLFLGLKFNPPR